MTQPTKALQLADALDLYATGDEHQRDIEDAAAELRRLHYENERLAALVEAQQPAPSAAVASKAVLTAIRAANLQLVRTGDDEFMLVPYKVATAQAADSVLEDALNRLLEAAKGGNK